jgi:hypothetical protein
MPASRVSKLSTSSLRRHQLIARLRASGLPSMVICSHCSHSDASCIVGRDSSRCVPCVKRGLKCDGTFSVKEFDKVSEERLKLLDQVEASRRRSAELVTRSAELTAELARQSAELAR